MDHLRSILALAGLFRRSIMRNQFVALKTSTDGNCCFIAASLKLFGTEQNHLELRVRNTVFYLPEGEVITRMEAEVTVEFLFLSVCLSYLKEIVSSSEELSFL